MFFRDTISNQIVGPASDKLVKRLVNRFPTCVAVEEADSVAAMPYHTWLTTRQELHYKLLVDSFTERVKQK